MARFVSTDGISSSIEQIIKNSKKKLTLISPFVRTSKSVFNLLVEANERGVKIELVVGRREFYQSERKKIYSIKNIQVYCHENLHAKCYFNEDSLLITSMNLYGYSENNREMGVLFEKNKDLKIFNDAIKESKEIIRQSRIMKQFGNDIVNKHDHLIEGHKDYTNELYHLPSLYKMFIAEYPKYKDKTTLNGKIKVEDFPSKGIDMEISNIICIFPSEKVNYLKLKEINEGKIESFLPDYRLCWEKNWLKICEIDNYLQYKNYYGLRIYLRKMFFIIETLQKKLKTQID